MTSTKAKLIQIFGVDNVRSCAKQPNKTIITTMYGNVEVCCHTGYKVLDGSEDIPSNWWYVYTDPEGNYHLVR